MLVDLMRARIFFLAIVCFWLAMNFLLWRSQWGAHSRIGNAVPIEVVWEKILTAPDSSSLDIYDHSNKIGICHWVANVGNSPLASNKILADEYAPDGMEEQVTGYSLVFEGNAMLASSNRLRFDASMDLSTNRAWKNFHARVNVRPVTWDVRAAAAAKKVVLNIDDHGVSFQKSFAFDDLRNPQGLLDEMGGSMTLGLIAGMGLTPSMESLTNMADSMDLQAHEDWMQFGHTRARVYRVETTVLGQHVYLFTSRVGEILWVDLPGGITLRNEAFEHF
jgi:hypothetical protein